MSPRAMLDGTQLRVFHLIALALLACLSCHLRASAAIFTYQGVLKTAGSPLNGSVDLRFRLYAAASGPGLPLGNIAVNNVNVVNGLVNVDLDFGPNAFTGSDRWLEIDVASPTNGGLGPFTTLTPRQRVTVAPMSQFALNVSLSGTYGNAVNFNNPGNTFTGSGGGLTNLNASNLTSGTIGSTLLAGSYINALTLSNAGNVFNGSFNGNGSGLSSLNASNIGSGNLIAACLPLSGQWMINDLLRIDNSSLVVDPAANRVGIGVVSPTHTLDVNGNMSIDGSTLVVDDALNRVGIGTSSPTNTLHVAGATRLQGSTTIDGTAVFNQPVVLNSTMSFAPIERHISYGPNEFRPTNGTANFIANVVHYSTDGGQLYACRLPIHVPHGAKLKYAYVYVGDVSFGLDVTVSTRRKPLSSPFETIIDTNSSALSPPEPQSVIISFGDVIANNTAESYCIEARWTVPAFFSDIVIYGARVTYEVTNYLP